MPLPLLAIKIGAVVVGAGGLAAGVVGSRKLKKAKKIGKDAEERHKQALS